MAGSSIPSQLNFGAFVPTTDVYDAELIYELPINSKEFKEFLVRLRQSTNNIALVLNIKDSGYYVLEEFLNGQAFFPNPALNSTTATTPQLRQVFRITVNFGALPNAGAKVIAHGINVIAGYSFTRIYATATDPNALTFLPIPYAALVLNQNIQTDVDATNITITTGTDRTNYTICYVVLEYIKN